MRLKRCLVWATALLLALGGTSAQAQTIVIEDCGVCAGHVILGGEKSAALLDIPDRDIREALDGRYDQEDVIVGDHAIAVVSGMHDITLDHVLIDVSDQEGLAAFEISPGAQVHLTLEDENILLSGYNCAGIQVPQGAKLTITDKSSGSVTAVSGGYGAGIGGGNQQSSGEILIQGGSVIAIGPKTTGEGDGWYYQNGGAGIGAGTGGNSGRIVIEAGEVYADGYSAGIGGEKMDGEIVISGGIVYASSAWNDFYDTAAIGSAAPEGGDNIVIQGGTIYAKSSYGESTIAIGCDSGIITFSGGTVYAIGRIFSETEGSRIIVTDGRVSVNGMLLERKDRQ